MHIGIVGPCSSGPLADFLPDSGRVDLGRGGYSIVELVRALIGRGHRVSVVTLSSAVSAPRVLTGPSLTYYVYPRRLHRKMRDLYKVEREGLKEGILLAKADVLHAHWTYEYALACLETNQPLVVTCRDNAFQQLRFSKDLYRLGRLYIQLRVIREARFLTAVSPYLADSLRWLVKTGLHVVPNTLELSDKPKRAIDILPQPVRIATILNGWGSRKNPKAAIRAFNLLRRRLPDAELFMYGHGFEGGGRAAQWATNNKLSQNIHFCGFCSHRELLKALSNMSLLLHPALEESFGMVLVEAMALGLPVVGGIASGGVPWVLDNGQAGYLTDVRDPQQIAQTLLTCIENVDDRQQRQRVAYQRVLTLFSPASVAAQYERIYEKVLSLRAEDGLWDRL